MKQELIFEIGTEEIPAGYIQPAITFLQENLANKLKELKLSHGSITSAATPRRLTICVDQLVERQPDITEELLGPPKSAAYSEDGTPTKAAEGFARSRGVALTDIQIATTPKGEYLMVVQEQKGRDTQDILVDLLPSLLKETPFPKSMKWGESHTTFARPIQWLLARYNGQPISFSIEGVGESGSCSYGHRFMAPQPFEVTHFAGYVSDLRERHVLVDIVERRAAVCEQITQAAKQIGGTVLPDEELTDIVTNLVEKPHAICGAFDQKFLELPNEVLITSMREHQKYFAIADDSGNLKANFIAINNTDIKDDALGAEGHQRVLRARLEDAMFFFQDDCKKDLDTFIPELTGIVFQAQLGTMLEKSQRLSQLAGHLATILVPEKREAAERAALLAKADLLSAMVTEFPSLQGVMGHNYALRGGESPEVAAAIQDHYLPIRAGSSLPKGIVGALVGLADRIDTITGCFGIGQTPTGATDPFGLRRLALGFIHIVERHQFSLSLTELIEKTFDLFGEKLSKNKDETVARVLQFIAGRYTNDKIHKGIAAETIEAVTSVHFDDLIDCSLKIDALSTVSNQDSFSVLAGSFKRVMNILKDQATDKVNPDLFETEQEKSLFDTTKTVDTQIQPLIRSRNYQEAMEAILQMKEPVDHFFDGVMVMADNDALKQNRLSLLQEVANLFLKIGDFSKMYAIQK